MIKDLENQNHSFSSPSPDSPICREIESCWKIKFDGVLDSRLSLASAYRQHRMSEMRMIKSQG